MFRFFMMIAPGKSGKCITEDLLNRFVANGDIFLGDLLLYKSTKKSWQYWKNKELSGRVFRKMMKLSNNILNFKSYFRKNR
jgi:hypothetical protein